MLKNEIYLYKKTSIFSKIKINFNYFIIIFGILTMFLQILFANDSMQKDFAKWVTNFKKEAPKKYNLKPETLKIAFENVFLNEKIIELDRKQPEFTKTFWDYYKNSVNEERILRGKKQIARYKKILMEVSEIYDVPYHLIVAFWDLETKFGKNIGKSNAIAALATLSFDKRRSKFFTKELVYALKIIENNNVKPRNFKSSWAGAFGNFQFMPSTYTNYAVDGDGDGKIDLYNSIPDSLHSAANFISKMGWNGEYKWGRPVFFDRLTDEMWALTNSKEWRDLNYFIEKGIKNYNGQDLQWADIKAKLIAPMGKDGPVFLIYENFKAVMRWNNSTNYALSVVLLSDAYQEGIILDKENY